MKNGLLFVLKISLASLMLFALSCTKDNEKPEEPDDQTTVPTVALEYVSSDMNSVVFSMVSTDAAEMAYVRLNDLSQVPSANAILTGGVKVPVPEQNVTISNLTAGEIFYVAAAAVSEEGVYSEVQTLGLNTSGENCSFELTVTGSTQESIVYSVVPSNADTRYYATLLDGSEYGEASDAEIHDSVTVILSTGAFEAGISLPDYLAQELLQGEQNNIVVNGLEPDKEYLLVAYGISVEDGSMTTPMERLAARTISEAEELTFTLSYSDVGTNTVHVAVTPSNMTATYVWLCQPASNYPGLTEDDADAIAETYVQNVGHLLDAGMGLYTGSYDIENFDVMSNTKYYLFAFGYNPGIGISSSCELVSFQTQRGVQPEDFRAEIIIEAVTARRLSFRVLPPQQVESIYYTCAVIPTAEYSDEAAIDSVEAAIREYYEMQQDFNPGFTIQDAVSSVCSRGEAWFEPAGLTPATDYTIAAVSVTNDGLGVRTVTTTVKTAEDIVSDAMFTAEYINTYDGNEALAAGLFPDSNIADKGLAVFEFERVGDPAECYYYLANGDYSDPEEEYKTDDDLLSWITTNPFFTLVEESTTHVVIPVEFYDNYSYLGYYYTLLSVAKDDAGTWGPICRTMFLPKYSERGDIQELVDLINEIEQ